MFLRMKEAELIRKLRKMLRREQDPDTIIVFMQTIAELERQRKKRINDERAGDH